MKQKDSLRDTEATIFMGESKVKNIFQGQMVDKCP